MIRQRCPRTAFRLTDVDAMGMIDAVRQEPLHKLVFPVMIRGEHTHVYELSDIVKWFFIGGVSPTTRQPFQLHELEPVMYRGFEIGYKNTIVALELGCHRGLNEWKAVSEDLDETVGGEGGGEADILYSETDLPTDAQRAEQMKLLTDLIEENARAPAERQSGEEERGEEERGEEERGEEDDANIAILRQLYNSHARYMEYYHNSPQIYGSPLLSQIRNQILNCRRSLMLQSSAAYLEQFLAQNNATFSPPPGYLISPNSVAGMILRLKTGRVPVMKELGSGLFLGLVLGGTLGLLAQGLVASQLPANRIIMTHSIKKAPNAMGTAKSSSMFF